MTRPAPKDLAQELPGFVSADPQLFVLSRPLLDTLEFTEFLAQEDTDWERSSRATGAEEIIEFAGRICYLSFGNKQSPKTNREYIHALIRWGHESVLEHASWTFLLTGVSRAFTHQMVRHRVGFSFSQLSQQYHDETTARFVIPEEVKASSGATEVWLGLVADIRRGYQSMTQHLEVNDRPTNASSKEARRSVRSAARSILPNATETKLVFSANGRALRHFLSVRGAVAGDLEMRKVSALIYSRLKDEAPALLADFEMCTLEDGYPLVRRITETLGGEG